MTKLTKKDLLQYITTIRINFDNAYKTQGDEELVILVNSWYECLKDYPKEVCDKAVLMALKHAKFAPRLGDIVDYIEKMEETTEKTVIELWEELETARENVIYRMGFFGFNFIEENGLSQEQNAYKEIERIYEGLSAEIKQYVTSVNALIQISNSSDEQFSFEKGRFMKTMPLLKERKKTQTQMGAELNKLICETANTMALDYKK